MQNVFINTLGILGASNKGAAKLAIYSDTGSNHPGDLLAYSDAGKTIVADDPVQFKLDYPAGEKMRLAAGEVYWIAARMTQAAEGAPDIYTYQKSGVTSYFFYSKYAGDPPDPFPAATIDTDKTYSFFAMVQREQK